MNWFKRSERNPSPEHGAHGEGPKGDESNPYEGAEYRGPSSQTKEEVLSGYGDFRPESAGEGMDAIAGAIQYGGEFLIPNPDANAEDPFFWKGVAERLKTESNFGNARALQLAHEIDQRVNRALGETREDVAKTDGAKVDFSDLPTAITSVLKKGGQIAA